jgi:hypothetical protein
MLRNNVDVIEYCCGIICKDTCLVDGKLTSRGLTRANADAGQLQGTEDEAWEQVLACTFLLGSNKSRYGKLLEDLKNNYTGVSTIW